MPRYPSYEVLNNKYNELATKAPGVTSNLLTDIGNRITISSNSTKATINSASAGISSVTTQTLDNTQLAFSLISNTTKNITTDLTNSLINTESALAASAQVAAPQQPTPAPKAAAVPPALNRLVTSSLPPRNRLGCSLWSV